MEPAMLEEVKEKLIKDMIDANLIKTGHYKLKSGIETPIYIDLREVTIHLELQRLIVTTIQKFVQEIRKNRTSTNTKLGITGVPYGAVPIASTAAYLSDLPYFPVRKETKDYGHKADNFSQSNLEIILVEDVISSGSSIIETIDKIGSNVVTDVIVIVDRELGGIDNIKIQFPKIKIHPLCRLSDIMKFSSLSL